MPLLDCDIIPIQVLRDNYIWVIVNPLQNSAWVVDPGDSEPVLNYLKQHHLSLNGIFLTHHHWDHTNGVAEIIRQFPVPVIASPLSPYPKVTQHATEGKSIVIDEALPNLDVIALPGHTMDHLAYRLGNALFCGDTLFGAGCGRLFEGSAAQMYHSLQKITALPKHTEIYCGHEYTLSNLQFAAMVEPSNQNIVQRIEKATLLRHQSHPTVPSLLCEEQQTNPFLRCHVLEVQQQVSLHVHRELKDPIEVFAALRQWKDTF